MPRDLDCGRSAVKDHNLASVNHARRGTPNYLFLARCHIETRGEISGRG